MEEVSDKDGADDGAKEEAFDRGIYVRKLQRASVRAYVQTLQEFSVTFQDISVYVPKEKGCCSNMNRFSCLCDPLARYCFEYHGWAIAKQDPYYALLETTGYVKSGEMILVLSPDTQYSSALIQTLTGRLSDKYSVSGSIRVNGTPIPTDVMQGWRRIAAHVSANDDTHSPILTVRETLHFAAQCTRGAAETPEQIDDIVGEVLEILDLTSAADTVVGDENLRGVSGGQKRRVTIGEMLVAKGTRFFGLENITDGLSSQDSYNIIREVKSACQIFQSGAVISLNQPSDEIVSLFDKLLVLNHEGQATFFGPPQDRAALESIFIEPNAANGNETGKFMSVSDLCLTPMMDEKLAEAILARYQQSAQLVQLSKALRHLHDRKAYTVSIEELLPATKYASGFFHTFKVLGGRRAMLIIRNPTTYMRMFAAVFFGIIVGSLFSVLEQDLSSSLARTAFMFQLQFLTLLLSTGVTVPQNIRDRITYFKHRSSEFYSARVYYLCQVLYEIPLGVLEAALLVITTYSWVDMNPKPERFFFFLGVFIIMELVGLALGRLFCSVSRTQVLAKSVVSVATLLFSTVAGFMPKYRQIPRILRWLSWLSPPAYGFEALAINEYVGRELNFGLVSRGASNTEIGFLPGERWLDTLQIPRVAWSDDLQTIKIANVMILIILGLFIDLVGFSFMERGRRNFFSQIRRPQRFSKSIDFEADEDKNNVPNTLAWPSTLSVSNLCYYVPLKRKSEPRRCTLRSIFGPLLVGSKKGKGSIVGVDKSELQLLTNVSAIFRAGRAAALMGTSGAGKTTLLDVIAGYKTGGRITGDLTLSGVPRTQKMWQLLSGYAEQNDLLNPYLTVMETLKFTASCRLPASMDRTGVISNVVELMLLEEWVDYVIGVEKDGEGVPKHVRKRVTIAVQLVMLPKILFLDEPTTGLGTSAANLVMGAIRRSTTELNLITVATIHQPSKLIWNSFDDLLLLTKGGKVAYMGEMGPDSETVLSYFSTLIPSDSPHSNPADKVIAAVSSVSADEAQQLFEDSQERKELNMSIQEASALSDNETEEAEERMAATMKEASKGENGFKELVILTKRQLITQWRNPAYAVTRIFCSAFLAVYFGILFGGDKSTIEGAVLTIGSTFFITFILVVPMQAAVVPLVDDRAVLYREAMSGLYSRFSYSVASLLADIPFHILNCLLMFMGFYFIAGFQLGGDRPAYFMLMMFLCNWAFTSIGEVYAIVLPNEEAANGLAGLTTILSVLFMGFLIPYDSMPDYWKWANTSDMLRYVIQGLTSNELGGNYYKLLPDDFSLDGSGLNNTILGNLNNVSNIFLFPAGANLDSVGKASQASTFLNLVAEAHPSRNLDWNISWTGPLGGFISCGIENECFVDPIAPTFMSCFILHFPPLRPAPCKDEFDALVEVIRDGAAEIRECLAVEDEEDAMAVIETEEDFGALPDASKIRIILCILNAILPGGVLEEILEFIQDLIERIKNIAVLIISVVDLLRNGLPGEVILFVFGWAVFDDGELVAPYKWWYCMFAVSMFIVGLEVVKLFGTRFIVWTKR